MKWNYVSKIQDEEVFEKIIEAYNVVLSEEFIKFIKKYNAGTPEKYHIKIAGVERVVGSFLSFNKDEEDVDSAFLALDVLKGKNLLPFAIDPFGDYFCFNGEIVVFWKHEDNEIDKSNMSLNEFVESLY